MPGKRVKDVAPRFKNPKNNPAWKSNLTIDASDKTSGTGDKGNQLDHANAQLEVSKDEAGAGVTPPQVSSYQSVPPEFQVSSLMTTTSCNMKTPPVCFNGEGDPSEFFRHFERWCLINEIAEEKWPMLLKGCVIDEAAFLLDSATPADQDTLEYAHLKEAIELVFANKQPIWEVEREFYDRIQEQDEPARKFILRKLEFASKLPEQLTDIVKIRIIQEHLLPSLQEACEANPPQDIKSLMAIINEWEEKQKKVVEQRKFHRLQMVERNTHSDPPQQNPGKCRKELDKRRLWKSDLNINSPEESKDQKQLDKCSVISDWSITEDEKCGKKLDKDIPSKSNLNINSPGESKIQNQLDKCSVISDWSITEEEICGKELDNGIPSKSDLNLKSPEDSKDQNQLEKCNVISDWSRTEDDYSESDVGQFMHTLFRKQLYTDITFRSKNGEESLSAHRAVLAAKCQFFSKLLFGNKTKEAEDMKMIVEISNLPFNIFKKIVEYLYTDEIDLEDVPTVLDIFSGAKLYQVQSLSEKCESCIESLELTEDNVCSVLQMCNGRDIKELRNTCLSHIQENTEKVISSETFRKCIYNTVFIICNLPELSLNSEEQLIDAVAGWADGHPPHIKPQLIMPLLSNIRFLTLSAQELGSIIQKHPDIMTADDALKIMIFLNSSKETRNLEKLPAWCNRNTQRRCFKQNNIESALKGTDPKSGEILIPLKPAAESQEITKQSSILQIECVEGRHEIRGIKVSLPGLSLHQRVEFIVSVKTVKQKTFLIFQKRFVTTQKEKLFEFFQRIRISENQIIIIEVVAQSSKAFSLFQLDENQDFLENEHFKCCVTSVPTDKKQFTISEVQYDPQEEAMNNQCIPLPKKENVPSPQELLISLKPSAESQKITEQSSLLQIKCIKGSHQINSIKFSFRSLPPNESISLVVSVKVAQQKTFLDFRKYIFTRSKEKLFEFVEGVRISEGQVANIEVIAKSVKPFSLFQLDENQDSLENEHFQCCVTSEPADKKQFTISEVQFGPQEQAMNNQCIPLLKKGVNDCKLPGENTEDVKQTTKRVENKRVAKEENDVSSGQETTDEEIASNNEKNKGSQLILSCTDTKESAEETKEREVKRKEILEEDAQVSTSVDENAENRMMSRPIEEKSGKGDVKKEDVDEAVEDNEVPECDREKIKSDQGNVNQSTIPLPVEKRTGKSDSMKQETDGETKEKSEKDVESKMIGEGNCGSKTKPSSDIRSGNQNLKKQGINAEGKIPERDRKIFMSSSENNGQMTLPWSGIKRTEIQNMQEQEVIDKERKEMMTEINRKMAANNEIYSDKIVLSSSDERGAGVTKITNKQDEDHTERNKMSVRDRKKTTGDDRKSMEKPNNESKVGGEKRKGRPEMRAEVRDNDLRNDKRRALLRPIIINTSKMEMGQYEGKMQSAELLAKGNKQNKEIDSAREFFFPLAIFLFILIITISYYAK